MWVIGINAISVVVGSLIGLTFKKWIKQEIMDAIIKSLGVGILIIGFAGALRVLLYLDGGVLQTRYELLLIVSIALGTLIGEGLKLDERLTNLGKKLENRLKNGSFSEGFIGASLIFCVGAMAILGSFAAASGDPTILYLKSLLDGVTSIILSASLGFGVIFSSISLFIYQGAMYLLFLWVGNFMSLELIDIIGLVGYVLIACIGLNWISFKRIKVVNMLPSLLVAVAYYLLWM